MATITALSTFPLYTDYKTLGKLAYANGVASWLASLLTFQTQANSLRDEVIGKSDNVDAKAIQVENDRVIVVSKEALVSPHYVAINAVYANATNINAVNANKTNINAVNANKVNIDIAATNKVNIDIAATNIDIINTNATNIVAIQNADANATTATQQAVISTQQAVLADEARIAAQSAVAALPEGSLADEDISLVKTWSSSKINDELDIVDTRITDESILTDAKIAKAKITQAFIMAYIN